MERRTTQGMDSFALVTKRVEVGDGCLHSRTKEGPRGSCCRWKSGETEVVRGKGCVAEDGGGAEFCGDESWGRLGLRMRTKKQTWSLARRGSDDASPAVRR